MKKLLIILISLMFFCCKQKDNNINNLNTKTDSLSNFKINSVEVVKFEDYQKEGVFLKGNFKIYDENFNEIEELKINEITEVSILGKTKIMYNLKNSKDYCEKAYFIKVSYNNKDYVVFGQNVFEINKEQIFSFTNPNGDKSSIFPVKDLGMGASDEEELTGCDDYSVLIIKNEKKQLYSIIAYPENEKYPNQSELKKSVLNNDEYSGEEIYKVTIKNDTLIIGIKAIYQEGGATYNLKTTFDSNFSKSIITDKTNVEEGDLKKLEDLK